ncbi:uncharacterized protein [Triticum aestivum]|uniref:uncharacterized protein n=1 Tax=Triticum aestivum TaxID=4565 RepID=UPI001D025151|nr:uncharacterized protein LOC123091587 [Triticum aestivum]
MDLSDLSSAGSGSGTNPFGDPPSAGPSVPLHLILSLNIASAMPVTLELHPPPNYTTWSSFLHALLMSYNIQDHVNGTVDARNRLTDAVWTQVDWCIIRWLLGSISAQVRGAVNHRNPTAYTLWTAIRQLFLSNRNQQGILALEEFHGLHQNDLSITDYFTRLQTLADTLFDCGMPVTDRGLVSNMLRGLSNKFAHAISTMTYDDSKLPTFLQARTYLLQEERRIDHAASHESATALYAGRPPAPPPPTPSAPPSAVPCLPSGNGAHGVPGGASGHAGNGGGQRGRKRRKGGNGGGQGGHGGAPPPQAAPPLPAYVARPPSYGHAGVNPWTGTFNAWPVTMRPSAAPTAGLLGPRPPLGLAATTYSAGPPPAAAPVPWDTSALQAALLAMQQQPYSGGGDWILDTGASSHMAGNPGPSHWDGGAPM